MSRREFRPGLLPTIVTLALFPALIALGFWQLTRADEKRALVTDFSDGGVAAVELERVLQDGLERAARYQQVSVRGRYDPARQFLLDAMIVDGRTGYHVLTPLTLEGGAETVLVNRGWVPGGATRGDLPDIGVDPVTRVITGRINTFAEPGVRLGEATAAGDSWPRVTLYPDRAAIASALGTAVLPRVILLDPASPAGYRRDWRPEGIGPDRHIAYAVQWFALALALAIIYGVVNLKRRDD